MDSIGFLKLKKYVFKNAIRVTVFVGKILCSRTRYWVFLLAIFCVVETRYIILLH